MSDIFFDYLRKERDRLDRELSEASSRRQHDKAEIRSTLRLRQLVDDQMARWACDLSDDQPPPHAAGAWKRAR